MGDDGFAVVGENKRLAFLKLAGLLGAQDGNIVAGEGAAGNSSGLPGPPPDPYLPDQVGDLLVEGGHASTLNRIQHNGFLSAALLLGSEARLMVWVGAW